MVRGLYIDSMAGLSTASVESLRSVLQPLRRALKLVWMADARGTLGMAMITLINGLLPAAQVWVAKLIIDSILLSLQQHHQPLDAFYKLLPYLLVEFGIIFLGAMAGQFRRLLDEIIDHKIGFLINTQIIRKALRLELHYFENAEFYDKMQTARQQSEYRAMQIVRALFLLAANILTLISFLALLVSFSPWVALLLFGASLPAFVAQTRFSVLNFRLQSWKAPETRRMTYFEHLLTVDSSAKEVKLFGLGEPLLKKHSDLFWKVFKEDSRLAWRRSWASLGWGLLGTLSYYACYGWVILKTLMGSIGLGSMTMYISIFRQSQGTFAGLFENLSQLYENGLFMENLFSFLDLPEVSARVSQVPLPPLDPTKGLEVRNLSFKYQGREEWALRNVSFYIRPDEKVALVGENGSGKTTLIKLLTRLYDPTEGDILYQGRNLKDWDLDELRLKVGVIFQDFVRYQLTLRDNVGFGSVGDLEDQSKLDQAADRGGMIDLLTSFKEGWDTTLGGWFQKGRELSGGQWQKVALSRAFMREGEVIILDEPTSALDAEKEYEVFKRFKELTAGKMAFLISHRFSTVRMADQIIVLKNGQIEEAGSHAELLAHQKTYARLFEMQAEGYR